MANFKVFAGTIGPGNPGSFDNINFYYPVYATIVVLDENDNVVIPGGLDGQPEYAGTGCLVLSSTEPIEYADDDVDLKRKVMGNFAPQYPQILPEDTVTWYWMS